MEAKKNSTQISAFDSWLLIETIPDIADKHCVNKQNFEFPVT